MKKIIPIIIVALSYLISMSCSEEKNLLRKASVAADACDYGKALNYYDKILLKDSNSFYGNAGKGIILSEYLAKYDQAIPYLEKALKRSPEKNEMKINSDLGKSYHFIGNYPRALYYYSKVALKNNEESPDYDFYLTKRIADCKYALDHPEVAAVDQQSITNIGASINTDMPDYDPVYVNGQLIFTSKRQDTPNERKNGVDGRYFESMYISELNDGNFTKPRRYTFPYKGNDSRYKKGNESVLSASSDGKTLYIFRSGQVYEADLGDSTKPANKLPYNINFNDFQSGAFISSDGKTMLYSSDSPNGRGGTDIYKSIKDEHGNWSEPQSISFYINTGYNEDSPFLSEDGNTLYFCSNGLPGYGGYDIYKSQLINGEWSKPVNLGQPINTPGDETHFGLIPNSSKGYYASNRQGGYGDMDIYNVHYVQEEVPECVNFDTLLVLNAEPKGTDPKDYILTAQIPDEYKGQVKSVSWKVNGELLNVNGERVEHTFGLNDTYRIYAKVLVNCENCPEVKTICNETDIVIGEVTEPLVANEPGPNPSKEIKTIEENQTGRKTGKTTKGNVIYGELNNEQLTNMGWETSPAYFDYGGSALRDKTKAMLDHNIAFLKKNKDLQVIINGYTDSRGNADYNIRLSERRAVSVKRYMLQKGISKYRITSVKPYGESKVDNGCTDGVACEEAQHQMNRKVDFNVSKKQKSITTVSR